MLIRKGSEKQLGGILLKGFSVCFTAEGDSQITDYTLKYYNGNRTAIKIQEQAENTR